MCIVIPIYKVSLSKNEELSLELCFKKMKNSDIFFVMPDNLNSSFYENNYSSGKIKRFDNKYFISTSSYNKLMLNTKFYSEFLEYEYMLIYQNDALILGNEVDLYKFCELKYDYIGAPWYDGILIGRNSFRTIKGVQKRIKPQRCFIGNGGLSLRNIRKTINLLNEKKVYVSMYIENEDAFFAFCSLNNKCNYQSAPLYIAEQFALELCMQNKICRDKIIPFGVHAWEKYYPNIIKELYEVSDENI